MDECVDGCEHAGAGWQAAAPLPHGWPQGRPPCPSSGTPRSARTARHRATLVGLAALATCDRGGCLGTV
eukprot:364735-Chlamydomonas_euryale.AAC.6